MSWLTHRIVEGKKHVQVFGRLQRSLQPWCYFLRVLFVSLITCKRLWKYKLYALLNQFWKNVVQQKLGTTNFYCATSLSCYLIKKLSHCLTNLETPKVLLILYTMVPSLNQNLLWNLKHIPKLNPKPTGSESPVVGAERPDTKSSQEFLMTKNHSLLFISLSETKLKITKINTLWKESTLPPKKLLIDKWCCFSAIPK